MHRLGDTIPMVEIVANSEPLPGTIAIIDYPSVRHYAYVEAVYEGGEILISECNLKYRYGEAKCGYRIIDDTLSGLIGFHDPS